MSDDARPIDDDFARALEACHEQIMSGGDSRDSGHVDQNDDRIQSAVAVMELLNEVHAANVHPTQAAETENRGAESTAGIKTQSAPEHDLFELTSLGRFEIIEPIGRGGFGVVFRAFDPELKREVAIKIPRWDVACSDETRQRFGREAIAAAGLDHPGIVRVYEVDSDRGLDFIVSELIDGENLTTQLAHGRRFGMKEAARIVSDIADALEHAHQRGVLHRDLKPANILLTDDPETKSPIPKISDFGLAAINGQTDLTQTGAMVGTPEYMSPEQAAGLKDQIREPSDVYGLGGILYYLIAGRSPFSGESLLETVASIKNVDPPAPSAWNPAVPRDLDAICLKCLEKEPQRRYHSARDLQADLNRFLNGQSVEARHVTDVERCIRWCRRNPVTSLFSFSAIAGVLIALVTVSYLWRVSVNNYDQAQKNQQKYLQKSEQLTSAIDRLFVSLANNPEIRQASADGLRQTLLEEAHQFQVAFLHDSPDDPELLVDYVRSMKRLADINAQLGDYRGSLSLVEDAIRTTDEKDIPIDENELTQWWLAKGAAQTNMGDFERANESYQQASSIWEAADINESTDQPNWARHKARIAIAKARSLLHQDELQQAEAAAVEARLALAGLEPDGGPGFHGNDCTFYWDRGVCQFILAQTHRLKREFQPAIETYQAALSDLEEAVKMQIDSDGMKFDHAHFLLGLGLAFAESNQPDRAVDHYQNSLSLLTELSDNHPQVESFRSLQSRARYSLAANRMVLKDFDAFEQLIETNIKEKKALLDDFPDARAKYFSQLGDAYNLHYFGRMREGNSTSERLIEILGQAKQAFEESVDVNPNWNRSKMALCRVISNTGVEHAKQKEMAMAVPHFREAIDRLRTMVADQPKWAEAVDQYYSSAASLIFVLQQDEKFDEAIDVANVLLDDCPDHRRAFSIGIGKARLLGQAERYEEAYDFLESVCAAHAGSWMDYSKAAETAIKISGGRSLAADESSEGGDTDGASSESENSAGENSNAATLGGDEFRSLAIQILKDAIEAYPQSKDELIDWLKSNPQLESLVEKLD